MTDRARQWSPRTIARLHRRARVAALAVTATALLAGCGGRAVAGAPLAPAGAPSGSVPAVTPTTGAASASPSHSHITPHTSPHATRAQARPTAAPSASARMVCEDEIRTAVATLVAPAAPVATATWRTPVFSCTYRLPGHSLIVEVRETGTAADAVADLRRLRGQATSPRTITGLASFGLPGFETPDGVVAFAKDDKTLRVDAHDLPAHTGTSGQSPSQVAYQVASDILGCWTGG